MVASFRISGSVIWHQSQMSSGGCSDEDSPLAGHALEAVALLIFLAVVTRRQRRTACVERNGPRPLPRAPIAMLVTW